LPVTTDMASDYKAIITFLLAGAALIHLAMKRPVGRPVEKRSHTAWLAFFLLVVPILGMVVASASGNQALVWLFGIGCMVAVPLWLLVTIILWVATLFRSGGGDKR